MDKFSPFFSDLGSSGQKETRAKVAKRRPQKLGAPFCMDEREVFYRLCLPQTYGKGHIIWVK